MGWTYDENIRRDDIKEWADRQHILKEIYRTINLIHLWKTAKSRKWQAILYVVVMRFIPHIFPKMDFEGCHLMDRDEFESDVLLQVNYPTYGPRLKIRCREINLLQYHFKELI